MSQSVEHITSSERVTEWLTPHDQRLMQVTGLEPPIDANSLREDWRLESSEIPHLLTAVRRLIVPQTLSDAVKLSLNTTSFGRDTVTGLVGIEFDDPIDLQQCLPINEQSLVFDRNGVRGNAAIALCGETAALAVIDMDYYEEGVHDFVVAPIKQFKLAVILAN